MERPKTVTPWVQTARRPVEEITSSGGAVADSWTQHKAQVLEVDFIGDSCWSATDRRLQAERAQQLGVAALWRDDRRIFEWGGYQGEAYEDALQSVDWKECCKIGQCDNLNWAPGRKSLRLLGRYNRKHPCSLIVWFFVQAQFGCKKTTVFKTILATEMPLSVVQPVKWKGL